MKTPRLATMCVIWIQGTIACGSAASDPIGGPGTQADGGDGGAASSGGGTRSGPGGGGLSPVAGGSSARGGTTNGGTSGASDDGGAAAGGAAATADAGNAGSAASGGTASDGGSSASGGDGGIGGAPACTYAHPDVNGSSRTCGPGLCYCSGTDSCYAAENASRCCKEGVVCGPGATNPVATIYHPGTGETRVASVDIPFSGVGTDPQDGALSGASLVWTSSALASPVGTGKTFNAALPAGIQVITLTATDSNSNTGTDTITLDVR